MWIIRTAIRNLYKVGVIYTEGSHIWYTKITLKLLLVKLADSCPKLSQICKSCYTWSLQITTQNIYRYVKVTGICLKPSWRCEIYEILKLTPSYNLLQKRIAIKQVIASLCYLQYILTHNLIRLQGIEIKLEKMAVTGRMPGAPKIIAYYVTYFQWEKRLIIRHGVW